MDDDGGVHILWRIGNGDSDNAGYMYSPDYGETWQASKVAVSTSEPNHPFSLVADTNAVHVMTAPAGMMQYASRPLR
jgi:hypothetical protein